MQKKKNLLVEIVGWYGAIALIGAYALVSFALVEPAGIPYQLLNVTGSVGIVVVSLHKRNYQPMTLNIFWAGIAVVSLMRLL